jgi:ribosomal protein S18 acetylase RimI-like enzyme
MSHFQDTSFVCEKDGKIIGFLVGFISQTYNTEAYIHYAGVHPEFRRMDIAKTLYETFTSCVKNKGCKAIRCITSPTNRNSIGFHKKMGFRIEDGDAEFDGIRINSHYAGKDQARVLFYKEL